MPTVANSAPDNKAKKDFTASFSDFNYNLCRDKFEEHCKYLIKFSIKNIESAMKVFNTYVQFCSLSYWGPQGGPVAPKMNQNAAAAETDGKSSLIQNIIA